MISAKAYEISEVLDPSFQKYFKIHVSNFSPYNFSPTLTRECGHTDALVWLCVYLIVAIPVGHGSSHSVLIFNLWRGGGDFTTLVL